MANRTKTEATDKTVGAEEKKVAVKEVKSAPAKKTPKASVKKKSTKPVVKKTVVAKPIPEKETKATTTDSTVVSENNTETQAPVQKSNFEVLQDECIALGIPFTELHKENDLQQLVSAVKSFNTNGVQPSMEGVKAVEVNLDNIDSMTTEAPEKVNEEPVQRGVVKPQDVVIPTTSNLGGFRDMFMATIQGHFRLMSMQDINDMFKGGAYPFSYNINRNPSNENQIEIHFKNEVETVRLPNEDKNQWIAIS